MFDHTIQTIYYLFFDFLKDLLSSVCEFLRNISSNKVALLKLMKFSKQSPIFKISEEEENDIFADLERVSQQYEYFPITMTKTKQRPNSFISLCQFAKDPPQMRLNNCDKFRRSFTNRGLGFTFNNKKADNLYKHGDNIKLQLESLFFNKDNDPKMMHSASPDEGLKVLIENNMEEINNYEKTKVPSNVAGDMKKKPVSVLVVLHDPSQPANMRTKSITIPLGQSSTVYITPSATETDTSGQMLGETQRECRLKQENDNLQVFREVLINSKTN